MKKKSKSTTQIKTEVPENRPIIIAKGPGYIYAWSMLLQFQRFGEVKVHAHPSNKAVAMEIISLFEVLNKEIKSKEFVKTTNSSNNEELEVVEFTVGDKRRPVL